MITLDWKKPFSLHGLYKKYFSVVRVNIYSANHAVLIPVFLFFNLQLVYIVIQIIYCYPLKTVAKYNKIFWDIHCYLMEYPVSHTMFFIYFVLKWLNVSIFIIVVILMLHHI